MAIAVNFKGSILNLVPEHKLQAKTAGHYIIPSSVICAGTKIDGSFNPREKFVDIANNVWSTYIPYNANLYCAVEVYKGSQRILFPADNGGICLFSYNSSKNTVHYSFYYNSGNGLIWDIGTVSLAVFIDSKNNGRTPSDFVAEVSGYNKTDYIIINIITHPGSFGDYEVLWRLENNNTGIGYGGATLSLENFVELLNGSVDTNAPDPLDPGGGGGDDPYFPGGESGEGGGGGTFDDESDPITKPSLPTLSSANTGFTRIYNPTLSQVQDLANYLWTDESVVQTIWNHIKQFFENPMDAIIGFNLVPVPVPDAGSKNFALMFIDTGVSMNVAASQFVDVDCGTLTIEPYYGSALDYSPYTQISCFLPYIGNVSLDVDEVMGRTLQVSYRVDICSGSCVAYIEVDGNAIYQYSGHCAIPIPLAAADFSSYVNAAISTAKLAGASLLAGMGVGAAMHVENTVQTTNQTITKSTPTAKGGTRTSTIEKNTTQDETSTEASFAGISPQNITNTVGQVMSSKPHIEHSGSFSGNSGYLGVRRPFIIIKRPNMCLPSNFQKLNGYPSMITLNLGDCTGFTRVQQVQLTGLTATNPEQGEIMSLLKTGVVF